MTTLEGSEAERSAVEAEEELKAQALIEEARRRHRRRLAGIAITVVIIVVAAIAIPLALTDRGKTPPRSSGAPALPKSLPQFIRLAKQAAAGTFAATYQVGGARSGVVVVAQRKAPEPSNPGSGTWSFMFQTPNAISSQWIQKGSTSWDCWRFASAKAWTCSGPGTYRTVNGFILSINPYIPMSVTSQLNQLQQAIQHKGEVRSTSIFHAQSKKFGEETCLKVSALTSATGTMCIDRMGVLVSEEGGFGPFPSISLRQYGRSIPRNAFVLLGTSTSSGSAFLAIPS